MGAVATLIARQQFTNISGTESRVYCRAAYHVWVRTKEMPDDEGDRNTVLVTQVTRFSPAFASLISK
jgi:hypothetical protein